MSEFKLNGITCRKDNGNSDICYIEFEGHKLGDLFRAWHVHNKKFHWVFEKSDDKRVLSQSDLEDILSHVKRMNSLEGK